ncbi:MAG: protein kinase [Acidobacteriota bacterium]|nr:protein kinase [Acidobacteriota bacterium]
MRPEEWQRIKELYAEADQLTGEDRENYLNALSPSDAEEVRSLLKATDQSEDFLSKPVTSFSFGNQTLVGRRIGRYEIISMLGAGGMGEVYEAERTDAFRQQVALKLLRRGLVVPEMLKRFHLERQILADLEHPNIARVIDGGTTEGGRPYLVMELVRGEAVDQFCEHHELPLKRRLELFREVCSAVFFAHQHRVIHRDIKPSNVLVTNEGRPKLIDFGIAHADDSDTHTRAMTPRYASPEQIRGEPLTTSSDIYTLGVLLYELITGRSPYRENTNPSVEAVAGRRIPVRKVDPHVPSDVAFIVETCLKQDPVERYGSARDLADDLKLFMQSRPIKARPATLPYIISRRLKRNRPAAIIGGVALIALMITLGWVWQERARNAERIRLAALFGRRAESIEATTRFIKMLPRHDVREEMQLQLQKVNELKKQVDEMGPRGMVSGYFALGRGYLAMGDYQAAREALSKAYKGAPDDPEIALALGRTLSRLYQEKAQEAEMLDAEEKKQALDRARREYREPALTLLTFAEQAGTGEMSVFTRALMAFHEKRYEDALTGADRYLDKNPWSFEADRLKGAIYMDRANGYRLRGEKEKAWADYAEAGKAFRHANIIAPSVKSLYLARARLDLNLMQFYLYSSRQKGSLNDYYQDGYQACVQALEIDPTDCDALRLRALLGYRLSESDSQSDQVIEKSLADARASVAACPDDDQNYLALGLAQLRASSKRKGEEKAALLHEANENLEHAASLLPSYRAYNARGMTMLELADVAGKNSPLEYWDEAIRSFTAATREEPELNGALANLSKTHFDRAEYLIGRGRDGLPDIEESIAHGRKAFNKNKTVSASSATLVALITKGRILEERGLSALDEYQTAATIGEQSLESLSHYTLYLLGGTAVRFQARAGWHQGIDPLPLLEKSKSIFEQGLKDPKLNLKPRRMGTLKVNLAISAMAFANYSIELNRDGIPQILDRVEQYLVEARRDRADDNNPSAFLVETHLIRAEYLLRKGEDPLPSVRKARTILEQLKPVLEKTPAVFANQPNGPGQILLLEARASVIAGRYRGSDREFNTAASVLDATAQIEVNEAAHTLSKGEWARWYAVYLNGIKRPVATAIEPGLAVLDTLLISRPGNTEARALRGTLYLMLARDDREDSSELLRKAVADLDRALKDNPLLVASYGADHQKARQSISAP